MHKQQQQQQKKIHKMTKLSFQNIKKCIKNIVKIKRYIKLNVILPLNSTGLGLGGLIVKLYKYKQIMDFILKSI